MEHRTERTLVKSPPELWELLDDNETMERWCAALLGLREPLPVEVTLRAPGERIAWRYADRGLPANVDISLTEKDFGTKVAIRAAGTRAHDAEIEPLLEKLLDELGSPQRRPFAKT
jgi:uncharacterized protein YndB with AHSA1/START domain